MALVSKSGHSPKTPPRPSAVSTNTASGEVEGMVREAQGGHEHFFLLKESLGDPILASNKGDLELLNFSFLSLPRNCWDYLTNHDLLLLRWESNPNHCEC